MGKNNGRKPTSLLTEITVLLSALAAILGALGLFSNQFGFDLDDFGDAKAYFQSPEQKRTSSPQTDLYFQRFLDLQLFKDGEDCLASVGTDTNRLVQYRELEGCYSKTYATIPKVYSDIESFNRRIGWTSLVIMILWISSLWMVRFSASPSVSPHQKVDPKTQRQLKDMRKEIDKLKEAKG